jgi:hypothetical protein
MTKKYYWKQERGTEEIQKQKRKNKQAEKI